MAYVHKIGSATLAIAAVLASPAMAQDVQADSGQDTAQPGSSEESAGADESGRVTVRAAELDPRYGNIDPFYGDIGPFWGNIGPFYGNIGAFYGTINPFWDDISPFYGDIGAFWGDIDAFWSDIGPFDEQTLAQLGNFWSDTASLFRSTEETWAALAANSSDPALAAALNAQLLDLIARSDAQWGGTVAEASGEDFQTAFVAPIFARHGIDLSDPASLATLTSSQRAAFFLDWHDSLMGYSGIDNVDHWMAAINWTPALTQIQGSTGNTVIGILDSTLTGSADLADNVVSVSGSNSFVSGHGAGVASLMVAAHDGQGIMGIAPNASVVAHNPFDASESASWEDVQAGIAQLNRGRASIINLSLGEPGMPLSAEWRDIFTSTEVAPHSRGTVYVLAAGNDGVAQQDDVEWGGAFGTSFLLVGSVGLDGTISDFSNRPGDACLLDNGVCAADGSNDLMNYFIVAPGEMILVDDGMGGTVRRSGTSFSAPLVSGAVALLHDRWPWLASHPDASVEIILRSARDLGAPGVDEVYGAGMLDIVASQSPLNFNDMSYVMYRRFGNRFYGSRARASSLIGFGVPSWWETSDVFFTMYEDVGDTYRDFVVPMSTYTTGKRTNALGSGYQRLQDFVSDRFARWILSNGTDTNGDGVAGISQLRNGAELNAGTWGLQYSAAMPRLWEDGAIDPVHSEATLTDPTGKFAFSVGHGQGAMALSGTRFGVISDYDRESGGVNPVLGFASGEFFTGASFDAGATTRFSVGYSENRLDWNDLRFDHPVERYFQAELGAQEAHAFTFGVDQDVSETFSLNLQYTQLRESNALLGAQADMDSLLGEGSRTEALTMSGTLRMGQHTRLDVSATAGATETAEGQFLSNDGRVFSTAGQVALTRTGLFAKADTMRVALGQPLNIEQGALEFHSLGVIDRETGETGRITQSIAIKTKRRIMGEFAYAAPVSDTGEVGLFGRYVSEGVASEDDGVTLGANFGLRF